MAEMTQAPAMPPDLFGQAFRWHGRFLPAQRLGERLLLVSENEWLLLGSAGVLALEEPLRRGQSLAEHCSRTGMPGLLAEMLHGLGALLRQGLVQPLMQQATPAAPLYRTPDFSAPPLRLPVSGQLDVVLLTAAVDPETARQQAQALASDATAHLGGRGLSLVYCDDYLDPRLSAIDAAQRSAGRPWMLFKPTGEQALAGPLFGAQAGLGACWHCLAHRWLRNQPARAWRQARQDGMAAPAPVRADADLLAARLPGLLPLARQLLAAGPGAMQSLWTLEPAAQHAVAARPQCLHCGTPGLMAQRQHQRIAPAAQQAAARSDGGWRTLPASETVERLSRHLSPLTGVIARIQALNAESGDALTVYRSEIFRTPAPGGDPTAAAWTQVCLGKGLAAVQARASALCEAVERYAAFYQGDEAVVYGAAEELDAPAVAPAALAHFSPGQLGGPASQRPPHAAPATDRQAPPPPRWWVPAWSLTADARRYLPLGFCLAHTPVASQCHVTWTSNGCAAGNTVEEAILQGFLELVERDAAAIWWYGRVRRRAVALHTVDAESRRRLSHSCGPQWTCWMLDITHDMGIPVVVAVGRHGESGEWALGFGCSTDLRLACERALTEIGQLIAAGKHVAVAPSGTARNIQTDQECREALAFLYPLETEGEVQPPLAAPAAVSIADEIARCVAAARGLGLETIVYDHTRPDIPLHTVKVVVPGLCHIWPERANPRLRDVPVAMGWRDEPLAECQLNPLALYV
jgi:ribosomal protein S12 methylthiotransferase accessory factor